MKSKKTSRISSFAAPAAVLAAALAAALTLNLAACNGDSNTTATENPDGGFPVNETFAGELAAKGVPTEAARYFAAAKLEASQPVPDSFAYRFTYPDGLTREIGMKFDQSATYQPTAADSARIAAGGAPLYGFTYDRSTRSDESVLLKLGWFVPASGVPEALRIAGGAGGGLPKSAAATAREAEAGSGVAWGEVAKTTGDVGIGSLLDFAKDKGIPAGALGNIYSLASALSALGGAAALSQQNAKWLLELDALEKCAGHPTNPVAKSDPNYIPTAVGQVRSTRSELQEVNAVRFLNQMTETGSGITPVTAAMSIGLKQGFVWSENTLNDYSEQLMREARLAVVKCDEGGQLKGTVTVEWDCHSGTPSSPTYTTMNTVSQVEWIWSPDERMYVAQGDFTYARVVKSGGGGTRTCTYSETTQGGIAGDGRLMLIEDVAAQNLLGFGYSASGFVQTTAQWTDDCQGTSGTVPVTVVWLPDVQGFPGTGGGIEGVRTKETCIGIEGPGGSEKTTYEFEVAAPPR